jgi:4-amino-4-deoxy-L-arabinose transferase-like glycosyltransferase
VRAVNPVTRRDLLGLLLVLAVAALMRFVQPGVLEFLHDEAYLSLLAQDMVSGKGIPLTGMPSSVGVPNSPVSVYIMALPYAVTDNPQAATLFIAALNVLGVGILWLIARRYFGRATALAAGLVYAVSPWAVLYSRKIWAQDFHTPFLLLAFLLGMLGFIEGRRWAQILCLPVLFIGLQIHFAAWALLPVFALLLWVGRRNIRPLPFALSIVLAALTLAPFAAGLSHTLADDPARIQNALNRSGKEGLSLSTEALTIQARFVTGWDVKSWVAPENADFPPAGIYWLVLGLAALVGIATILLRPKHNFYGLFPLLWVVIPVLVFTPTWTPVYPHYFIAGIPMLCLLAGIGFNAIVKNGERPIVLYSAGGVLCLLIATQAAWWLNTLRYVDRTDTPEGFGTPMRVMLDVRNALQGQEDVVVLSDGMDVLYDQEPAVWAVMLRREADCIRTITGRDLMLFPAHPFAALTAPNALDNPTTKLYRKPDEQVFPTRAGQSVWANPYRLSRFDTAPAWDGPPLTSLEAPAAFGGGAQLSGYHLSADRLYLEWRLPGPVEADYHYFAHFLDAAGEKIGQRDNTLWPGRFWCAGDRLITWADIQLPEGTTTLRVGLYTLKNGGFINAPVLDSAGNAAGTWVDIPLKGS